MKMKRMKIEANDGLQIFVELNAFNNSNNNINYWQKRKKAASSQKNQK